MPTGSPAAWCGLLVPPVTSASVFSVCPGDGQSWRTCRLLPVLVHVRVVDAQSLPTGSPAAWCGLLVPPVTSASVFSVCPGEDSLEGLVDCYLHLYTYVRVLVHNHCLLGHPQLVGTSCNLGVCLLCVSRRGQPWRTCRLFPVLVHVRVVGAQSLPTGQPAAWCGLLVPPVTSASVLSVCRGDDSLGGRVDCYLYLYMYGLWVHNHCLLGHRPSECSAEDRALQQQ